MLPPALVWRGSVADGHCAVAAQQEHQHCMSAAMGKSRKKVTHVVHTSFTHTRKIYLLKIFTTCELRPGLTRT